MFWHYLDFLEKAYEVDVAAETRTRQNETLRRRSQKAKFPKHRKRNASAPSFRNMCCVCPALEAVPKVDIDPEGVFKYILLKVHGKAKDNLEVSTTIVRGYKRCEYHSDIYEEVQAKLKDLDCEPLGGGRISHDSENKKIHIYGYSQGYGKADHEIAAKLVKEAFPGYTITISDEGY